MTQLSRADKENMVWDVAIVGYGPTGAVLANLLAQAGLRIIILEKAADVYPLPRAAHFDGETLRVFQSIGLLEAVTAFSRPGHQGMHFENADGQILLVRTASDQPGPHGFANNWYFHQPDLERALRAGVARYPNASVCLLHDVLDVSQSNTTTVLKVCDLENKIQLAITARYVVGCDGARSIVRQTIGSENIDLGLHQAWLCLDLIMRRAVDLPEYTLQLCDPTRPMTLVNMAGRRRRWEIMLLPEDDPEAISTEDTVWSLLSHWLTPEDAKLERSAVYTFHSLLADRWRDRRLLIAGDAAHQTPPFLGQGMCAGIRDAANLSWKLACVLCDGCADTLLDSYPSERQSHVRAFIDLAVRVGAIVQITDPVAAAERDRHFAKTGPEIFAFPVPKLGPGVHIGEHPAVATVFPQLRLDDGRLLDEALDHEFALLTTFPNLQLMNDVERQRLLQARMMVLKSSDHEVLSWLREQQVSAVLLRPDRYVLGVAKRSADINRLLEVLPI